MKKDVISYNHDTNSLRESLLFNGSPLLRENNDEEYDTAFEKAKDFILADQENKTFSLNGLIEKFAELPLTGRERALVAICVGTIIPQMSTDFEQKSAMRLRMTAMVTKSDTMSAAFEAYGERVAENVDNAPNREDLMCVARLISFGICYHSLGVLKGETSEGEED